MKSLGEHSTPHFIKIGTKTFIQTKDLDRGPELHFILLIKHFSKTIFIYANLHIIEEEKFSNPKSSHHPYKFLFHAFMLHLDIIEIFFRIC